MKEDKTIRILIIGAFGFLMLLAVITFLGQTITIPGIGEITVFTAIITVVAFIAFSVFVALIIKLIEKFSDFF